MPAVRARGFTVVEVAMAVLLLGLMLVGVTRVMVHGLRRAREFRARAEVTAAWRIAQIVSDQAFSMVGADPRSRSDIVQAGPSQLVIRWAAGMHVICGVSPEGEPVLTAAPHVGRSLDPEFDSLLVMDARAAAWSVLDLVAIETGARCRDGSDGLRALITGTDAHWHVGSPVLALETIRWRAYPGSDGRWWIGMSRHQKLEGRWPSVQPVVGPFAAGGVEWGFETRGGLRTEPDSASVITVRLEWMRAAGSERRVATLKTRMKNVGW